MLGEVGSEPYACRSWKVWTSCFSTPAWALSTWQVAALCYAVEELDCTTLVIWPI